MDFNRFIILKRRNYLRKLVSSVIADKTLRWHQTHRERPKLIQIELALDEIQIGARTKPLMVWLQNFHDRFLILEGLLSNQKVLQLTYEDDIELSPLLAYERVCDFIGVKPYEVSVRYGKTNPFKLDEMIINFEEIVATLRGTPFEWMVYQ